MTVSKELTVRCNECYETVRWNIDVLRHQKLDSVLKNAGYETESGGLLGANEHYCPDCNDRERETFHVYDGHCNEYLGPVEAWGIVDARDVAWDTFECENMVKRERIDE